jgi:hypothetical protein
MVATPERRLSAAWTVRSTVVPGVTRHFTVTVIAAGEAGTRGTVSGSASGNVRLFDETESRTIPPMTAFRVAVSDWAAAGAGHARSTPMKIEKRKYRIDGTSTW